ncbi:MAG: Gfo/Idh/MocA family oxidoreductase [Candidatus Omnitrophica bacterium]|nr:Gfo/Idh/MocA family oxidoreductase [Candidatus Omnitrophota bacterium]
MKKNQGKIKVGVFGARRGATMVEVLSQHPEAQLVAICDFSEKALAKNKDAAQREKITLYKDFNKFLNHDMDAVVLANYATEHAPYAVQALNSGRHVCSEVVACQNLAEAVELVEAVEQSRKVYAFAENYCYFRGTLEMQKIYQAGDIGEFLHAEGEYVHDCESIWAEITYGQRNHWRNWTPATFYCTHSVGPIMTITNTRPVRVTAYETPNINKRRLGGRSADGAVILCQMSNGGTMKVLPWCNFKRHPESIWYCVYGSTGMMETDRWESTYDRIHVYQENHPSRAENFSYKPTFPHSTELSRRISGHGGSDFYTMHYFLQKILGRPEGKRAIDVYQGLDMTLPGLLGYRSIVNGNIPIDIPDFRDKKVREKYRGDRWCCDPKLAGSGQPQYSWSGGEVKVPDSVYRKQQKDTNG